MSKDLFTLVMEAEGDLLQPFDGGESPDTGGNEQPPANDTPPSSDAEPPEMGDDEDLSFSDSSSDGGADMGMGEDDENSEEDGQPNKEDEKLSEKANNILNQQLYQRMIDRNSEIEEIINNIQMITPMIPYELVTQNDKSLNQLKTALNKGQNYAISKFIDNQYGENLLFFQKLDSLYTLLLDTIDANLKSINKK